MSVAVKLSNLGDRMSGANLQMEGHADVPSQSAEDQQELDVLGSSPSHLLSWSLARRPPSGHPNTRYGLEIHVTLTKELGAVSPPSHSWMAPLVEDMLCDVRTGLTKAVVIGPGRAVLFHGRHSLGEDLTTDKARDAAFLLTRASMWVGKPAYLAANPMTIQEGWWAIAQVIMDCQVKARGPGHPCVNPSTQQPFRFDCTRGSPLKNTPREVGSNDRPLPHWPLEAKIAIDIGGTKGHHCLGCCHLPQTVGLRATGICYRLPHQCHPGQIDQRDLSIPDVGDSIERTETIWR